MLEINNFIYIPVARGIWANTPEVASEARRLVGATIFGLRAHEERSKNAGRMPVFPTLTSEVDAGDAELLISEAAANVNRHTDATRIAVGLGVTADPSHPNQPGRLVMLTGDNQRPTKDLGPKTVTAIAESGRGLSILDRLTNGQWAFVQDARIYPPHIPTGYYAPIAISARAEVATGRENATIIAGKALVSVIG